MRAPDICEHRSVNQAGEERLSRLRDAYEARLASLDVTHHGYRAAFAEFSQVLLANGGDLVVPPGATDIMIGPVGEMGSLQSVGDLEVRPMEANNCHVNAATLWRGGEVPSVSTGYAMSEDRLWREHSWGLTADGAIVETNAPRVLYFGFVFEGGDAAWFADWILPIDG